MTAAHVDHWTPQPMAPLTPAARRAQLRAVPPEPLPCPACQGIVRHALDCHRRDPAREITAPAGFCRPKTDAERAADAVDRGDFIQEARRRFGAAALRVPTEPTGDHWHPTGVVCIPALCPEHQDEPTHGDLCRQAAALVEAAEVECGPRTEWPWTPAVLRSYAARWDRLEDGRDHRPMLDDEHALDAARLTIRAWQLVTGGARP